MVNTSLIYNFGQIVLVSSESAKKAKTKLETKDPDEHQVVEGYEGECEKCESQKPQKTCSVCGE